MKTNNQFIVADEVAVAMTHRRPVVALETTLVTHGLPHPHGIRVAVALEAAVRDAGAIPATIGILDGAVRVGLRHREIETLATPETAKVNPSNLAAVVASGRAGSLTVAGTVWAAAHAGIRVFATGGIGGVHRDAAASGDISADLPAIARFPVAVVCAGAKAILDLPRTREMLETLGVPVLGFGTDEFPSFYRRSSGLTVDARCDSPDEVARAIEVHFSLGLSGGLIIANPIPTQHELPSEIHDAALASAIDDVRSAGIRGREVTPFLLERMRILTGDASLQTNESLLLHNATTAASIAVSLSRIQHA